MPTATADLDPQPTTEVRRLSFSAEPFKRVTHYLLRYPAKFHPPVVRQLIEMFTKPGDTILDPFCGSGTLLVEASTLRRHSVGSDIDPLAVLATSVKARRVNPGLLQRSADALLKSLVGSRRSDAEYERRKFDDISDRGFASVVRRRELNVPEIPRLFHWFRRYVAIDLAEIKRAIFDLREISATHRKIFLLCFAATVRRASNADPVPVSGLEVTSHMRRLDEKGRVVNPFLVFEQELRRGLEAFREYWKEAAPNYNGRAFQADARCLNEFFPIQADAVITSPPYHAAVDYYRRHTLESYWLGYAQCLDDRLKLLPRYIGRTRVSYKHEYVNTSAIHAPYMTALEKSIRQRNRLRADAFKHYAISMQVAIGHLASILRPGAPAVFVVGNSKCNGHEIDTMRLLAELAQPAFWLVGQYWYPLKNRYMTYSRHNGANIDRERVLVLERRGGGGR